MDRKILHILNAMISNLEVLNCELIRLYRTEQFSGHPECEEMIRRARNACLGNLDNIGMLEKHLHRQYTQGITQADNTNTPPEH